MEDKLDKFILGNRDEFDIHEPGPDVWDKIEKNIRQRHKFRWKTLLTRAAAILIIFVASYLLHEYVSLRKNLPVKAEHDREIGIPELREAEVYYTNLIAGKIEEIKPLLADYPVLEKEINNEFTTLDSIYRDLKKDLRDNISNDEVIEAMIQNYRFKLSVLEDIMAQLKSNNKEEQQKPVEYEL